MAKGEKRTVTIAEFSAVLDGEWARDELEELIGGIRDACKRLPRKYDPSVWLRKFEVKEMEIIPSV